MMIIDLLLLVEIIFRGKDGAIEDCVFQGRIGSERDSEYVR